MILQTTSNTRSAVTSAIHAYPYRSRKKIKIAVEIEGNSSYLRLDRALRNQEYEARVYVNHREEAERSEAIENAM